MSNKNKMRIFGLVLLFAMGGLLFGMYQMKVITNQDQSEQKKCAEVWEKYGEEKGATCFDELHLKNKSQMTGDK